MAYVEVRTTLPGHRKVAAASRRLGIPRPAVIGHLVCFWAWALENVDSSGSLAGVEAMDIAHAAGWPAKQRRTAERFVRDLVETGWISEEDGELFIHDWADYAGRLLTKREADAARKRAERAASRSASASVQRTSSGHEAAPTTPVQRTSAGPRARAVAPHRTVPTEETPPTPSSVTRKPTRRSRAAAESLSFDPDERPDLAALVDRGWRVSQAQADDLAEIANNERPSEHDVRGGFEVIASWVREAPKTGDLHRHLLDRENRLKGDRLAAADAAEADWSEAKAAAPALAPDLAAGMTANGSNGHGSRLSREELVAKFRPYRGQIADELLERQLVPHGLTLADLEDPVSFEEDTSR